MIKEQSKGVNAGKIHFDMLTKKEERKPVLGKILKNKAHFSKVIFTPNTGPTSVTASDDELETSRITKTPDTKQLAKVPIHLKKRTSV